MDLSLELLVIFLLILLNGVFAMSELALVSVRRARLVVLERQGVPGATTARLLSDDPQRFLPTVQVGITLVSVHCRRVRRRPHHGPATGLAADWICPDVAPFAESLSLAIVVVSAPRS